MKNCAAIVILGFCGTLGAVAGAAGQMTQKDYLSSIEADKIRDAETPNERIALFLTFAERMFVVLFIGSPYQFFVTRTP